MTKTLTEKWRDGELEEDFYYVKSKHFSGGEIDYYHVLHSGIKYWSGCEDEDIEEVLDVVPSYFEYAKLYVENRDLKEENESLKNVIKSNFFVTKM